LPKLLVRELTGEETKRKDYRIATNGFDFTLEISGPTTEKTLLKSRSPFFNTCNRIGTTKRKKQILNNKFY
jgi:hypothetical protein